MKLFNSSMVPNPWVSDDGTVRTETESQRELVATWAFKIELALYIKAFQNNLPREGRLARLNKQLEDVFNLEPEVLAMAHP